MLVSIVSNTRYLWSSDTISLEMKKSPINQQQQKNKVKQTNNNNKKQSIQQRRGISHRGAERDCGWDGDGMPRHEAHTKDAPALFPSCLCPSPYLAAWLSCVLGQGVEGDLRPHSAAPACPGARDDTRRLPAFPLTMPEANREPAGTPRGRAAIPFLCLCQVRCAEH